MWRSDGAVFSKVRITDYYQFCMYGVRIPSMVIPESALVVCRWVLGRTSARLVSVIVRFVEAPEIIN